LWELARRQTGLVAIAETIVGGMVAQLAVQLAAGVVAVQLLVRLMIHRIVSCGR
jgi:hypothetical protein